MLIDSHAHITDGIYGDGGRKIIDAMTEDGMSAIVTVGCDEKTSVESMSAARLDPRVFAAVGVHPYYPETVTDELLEKMRVWSDDEKVVAIGEIGLDYHYDDCARDAQMIALIKQYELSKDVGLPIIFHVRDAAGDFYEFSKDREFPYSGVMHCFSGSAETAEYCVKKGLYIAFGGKLTYKNSKNLIAAAARVPLDRLLIETDAPYLTPARHYGETNYPKYVSYVCAKLAEIRGMSAADMEEVTADNARRLFFKMKGV